MVGKLYKKRDYSKKRGTVQETICNEFFERKFGRNDFEELIMNVNGGNAVEYCLKYMRKTNSRGIYSRGTLQKIQCFQFFFRRIRVVPPS